MTTVNCIERIEIDGSVPPVLTSSVVIMHDLQVTGTKHIFRCLRTFVQAYIQQA